VAVGPRRGIGPAVVMALLGAGVAVTAAAFAWRHGWAWSNADTDGSDFEPVSWVNPLRGLAAAWVAAAVGAGIATVLLRWSRLAGSLACPFAVAVAVAGTLRYGGAVRLPATSDAGDGVLVLAPGRRRPPAAGLLLAALLATTAALALLPSRANTRASDSPSTTATS